MMLFWQVWLIQSTSNFFELEIRFSHNSWKANLKHSTDIYVDKKKKTCVLFEPAHFLFYFCSQSKRKETVTSTANAKQPPSRSYTEHHHQHMFSRASRPPTPFQHPASFESMISCAIFFSCEVTLELSDVIAKLSSISSKSRGSS